MGHPARSGGPWPADAKEARGAWWEQRIARQREIDALIAAKADFENLYDKSYEDKGVVRVDGPFTVESLSPHRMVGVDDQGERLDPADRVANDHDAFVTMVLENPKAAGVQQAAKGDRLEFASLAPWPGTFLCAEGRYLEGGRERRAGIFVGPEFGTVTRPDLVDAAKEAGDAGFDVVIVFDASTGEVRADDVDGIALWMVDTAYDGESVFVRHAYFLGANDPYKALKTTLRAEIDEEAWDALRSAVSRPSPKPSTGRIPDSASDHLPRRSFSGTARPTS